MSLDVSQVLQLGEDLKLSSNRVGAKVAKAVRSNGSQLERAAKAAAPVLTGALRDSISTETQGSGRSASISATVSTDSPYGDYVEFGGHGAPQPFLNPAGEAQEPQFVSDIEKSIEDL